MQAVLLLVRAGFSGECVLGIDGIFAVGVSCAGALKRKRAHIFWQKRIREGDTATPYWFPAKTDGGHMREDRLVLPIPPGVHWRDEMPILIPQVQKALPEPTKDREDKGSRKDRAR